MVSNNKITVIGIGRLGICVALCMERAGFEVLGVDVAAEYVASINHKTLDSPEPEVNAMLQRSTRFRATTSFEEGMAWSDLCFIVVPTNTIQEIQTYDHAILTDVLEKIHALGVEQKHLVITSTIFPGYIAGALPLFKDREGITISYNPEFIAQGDIIRGLNYPDLVLIGEGSPEIGRRLEEIYQRSCINVPYIARMSTASAEITKLALNCLVTAKIAFANLIGEIADATLDADKEAILAAIGKDARIGSRNMKPGYGFGGPCFPRDNRAMANYATLVGVDPVLFRATDTANEQHAEWMARKLLEQNLSEYVFEDVCFKPNCPVPIIEQSQKLAVARRVAEGGRKVTIFDTETVLAKVRQEFRDLFHYASKPM